MAMLTWDDVGSRFFETGVDRGVLFYPEGGGVAWNGLISVTEDAPSSVEAIYYDGRKINDIARAKSFAGRIRAYTYPEEFMAYEGIIEDSAGLLIAEQPLKRFNLSYRTKIGDDISGVDAGYRIHVLYDLTAIPASRAYRTLGLGIEPLEFEWTITSIPQELSGYRPTAHLIIDTRKVPSWFLSDVEEVLYGSDTSEPFLPSAQSFAAFLRGYDRIVIFDNGDGTWTASTTRTDAIVDNGDGTFTIYDANATFPDGDSFEISSTDKNEEDLWQP